MTGIVALELEPRTVIRTRPKDEFNILEGVAEDAAPATFKVRLFPLVFKLAVSNPKCNRAA